MKSLSSRFVKNKSWEKYSNIICDFLDKDAGRQKIIWAKHLNQVLSYGEDYSPRYRFRSIEALCYYNAFRNWPINQSTVTGELDEENLSIMISKKYIEENGYMDDNGYLDFNWAEDRFIINGIPYRPSGDTQVAQAKDQALVFLIILKRDRDSMDVLENDYFADINGVYFCDKDGNRILVSSRESTNTHLFPLKLMDNQGDRVKDNQSRGMLTNK